MQFAQEESLRADAPPLSAAEYREGKDKSPVFDEQSNSTIPGILEDTASLKPGPLMRGTEPSSDCSGGPSGISTKPCRPVVARGPYTSHFCEENIYLLVKDLLSQLLVVEGEIEMIPYVLFLSSANKTCPLWQQRLGRRGRPVVWDYHVIALYDGDVYDYDSLLPFPTKAHDYFQATLRPEISQPEPYQQLIRIVDGADFVQYFASDRSHMRESGMAFPKWPLCKGADAAQDMNLMAYVNMQPSVDQERVVKDDGHLGTVLTVPELFAWLDERAPHGR
jgi:protein N-terminal glutamine amidohydrolase